MAQPLSTPEAAIAVPSSGGTLWLAVVWGGAGLGALLAALALWFHYGAAVFFETIAAGFPSCFGPKGIFDGTDRRPPAGDRDRLYGKPADRPARRVVGHGRGARRHRAGRDRGTLPAHRPERGNGD